MRERNHPGGRTCRPLLPAVSLLAGLWLAGPTLAATSDRDEPAPRAVARAPQSVGQRAPQSVGQRAPKAEAPTAVAPAPAPASGSGQAASGHRDADRDRRGRRGAGRGGGGTLVFPSRPFGYFGYYGPSWFGHFGYPYYHQPFGWAGATVVYPNRRYGRFGALDLDLRPEKVQVFLDGQYIGVADQYDGFPNYLWLEEGTYDLVFYHPEFVTIARQYTIYPGLVIDVEDRMQRGEAIRPEDLPAKSTVRRDDRLRRDRERQERAVALYGADPVGDADRSAGPAREPGTQEATAEASGRLQVTVSPADASVYLDGRFLGTGEDLLRLHAGLIVEPGEHLLEVVRPGYAPETVRFRVPPGGDETLEVELDRGEEG